MAILFGYGSKVSVSVHGDGNQQKGGRVCVEEEGSEELKEEILVHLL